nr:reverse transcriptase domain-containing protein [Tanacetum cinerariifolium]
MSAVVNTTSIVITVTKPATNPRDADATPRVNIQDFCEEYYEDILPIIRDKVRRDKRKEVHVRIDFGEVPGKEEQGNILTTQVPEHDQIKLVARNVHVLVEILKEKSIQEKEVTTVIEEDGPTWMTSIMEYLKQGTLPSDRKEARKLQYGIKEIHEGSCSMHAGPRSVVAKAIRLGYYWPTMHRDARDMILQWTRRKRKPELRGKESRPAWVRETRIGLKNFPMSSVIPVEIGMPTYRTTAMEVIHNDEELRLNLDLLKERRERLAICKAKAKLKMTKYYNARVRGVIFRPGDFVYRSNDAIHAVDGGKLGSKWEGPYKITEALGDGAYKIRSTDGIVLPRTWNIANLKRCYL